MRAVSYFNTVPLVWGMLHGPERQQVDLTFSIPSECARDVTRGAVQVGLVPVAEIARQHLEIVPGPGITCRGAVRSILLFSHVPFAEIRSLAADSSSRTSIELARVILRERYGTEPAFTSAYPAVHDMLATADAALVIGDPALKLKPENMGYEWLDLGEEWFRLTGLPFVFAAWAGRPGIDIARLSALIASSYQFGADRLDQIIDSEFGRRGISRELAHTYLSHHIRFPIGEAEQRGLQAFLEMATLTSPALTTKP